MTDPSAESPGPALDVELGPLRSDEHDALFDLFDHIVASGEGFPQAPPLTRAVFEATWIASTTVVVAARVEGRLAGAYYLKPNQPGRAAHIANAGYVVEPDQRGRGVGRALVRDSIAGAPPAWASTPSSSTWCSSRTPPGGFTRSWAGSRSAACPDAVEGEDALIYWRAV